MSPVLSLRDMRTPRVFSLPPHVPFVDALAQQLLAEFSVDATEDDLALAHCRILLPNQRAVRALASAFLRAQGRAMLLPRLQAVGDTSELEDVALLDPDADLALPPAIAPLTRLMLLMPLVERWALRTDRGQLAAAETLRYARALASVIDQFDYAQIDAGKLTDLVTGDLAHHWAQTLAFLEIVFDHWPRVLAARGEINPVARRVALLGALADQWQRSPPAMPILIAGSTGTIPAVARLMHLAARLPRGAVLLPGLDPALPEPAWDDLAHSHPQFALRQALARMGVNRAEVLNWPHAPAHPPALARTAFTQTALWPATLTAGWQQAAPGFGALDRDALTFIEAASDAQEAQTIAIAVRHALEIPGRTVAIITGDRPLARRIAAHLRRFAIDIDDSAGTALALTPPAVFLRQLVVCAQTSGAPVELLALLKHPLCQAGAARAAWLAGVRVLDKHVLRGLRPAPGLDGLDAALAAARLQAQPDARDAASQVLALLRTTVAEVWARHDAAAVSTALLLEGHMAAAQALAPDLWQGPAGQGLAAFLAELQASLSPDQSMPPADFGAWLDAVLAGQVIRPRYGRHPRVQLLSPIEARLQHSDLMILAGLNEGSWPPAPDNDPFLADHMRRTLGLPTSEFRLGQAAHDFAQALGAPRVILTRARKSNSAPTNASRLWLRAEALLAAPAAPPPYYLALAQALDVPAAVRACSDPAPVASRAAWPAQLSVSDMAQWRQNPFAFHARRVLRLAALDPLDADPGASDRGTLLHAALEGFFRLPHAQRTRDALIDMGRQAFAPVAKRPTVSALWWPRFLKLADAVMASDLMTAENVRLHVELTGRCTLRGVAISGRADRIEETEDGRLTIYDYKSGGLSSGKDIHAALSPQLPLLALMAQQGGYPGIANHDVTGIAFVTIKGSATAPMDIKNIPPPKGQTLDEMLSQTAAILCDWIERFENPSAVYNFPLSKLGRKMGTDFGHFARVAEWEDNLT